MIDGNILKFGYGDIAVGSSALSNIITFQQFKPVGLNDPPKMAHRSTD